MHDRRKMGLRKNLTFGSSRKERRKSEAIKVGDTSAAVVGSHGRLR